MRKKRILITEAGSGFGEGAAIGMAEAGHDVTAGYCSSPRGRPYGRHVIYSWKGEIP